MPRVRAPTAIALLCAAALAGCGGEPPPERPPLRQDPALSVNPSPIQPPMAPGSPAGPSPPPVEDDAMPPGPVNPK